MFKFRIQSKRTKLSVKKPSQHFFKSDSVSKSDESIEAQRDSYKDFSSSDDDCVPVSVTDTTQNVDCNSVQSSVSINSEETFKYDEGACSSKDVLIETETIPVHIETATLKTRKKRGHGDPSQWAKEIRKQKRVHGESYQSVKGKQIPAKNFIKHFDCKCKLNCSKRITENERHLCYDTYYSSTSWESQTAQISGMIKNDSIHRRTKGKKDDNSRRQCSRLYYLKGNENDIRVCKRMFLTTLCIDSARVHRALLKHKMGDISDCRGKRAPINKTPDEDRNRVKQHIESFPRYTSHYTKTKNPDKLYLQSNLNLIIMYNAYKEHCLKENYRIISKSVYEKIFYKEFNLSFKVPQIDTCKICDNLNAYQQLAENDSKNNLEDWNEKQKYHNDMQNDAKEALKLDVEAAKVQEVHLISFDFQKVCPCPKLTTSVAYYKRPLWFYNFGIHNFEENKGYMNVWHEGIASRGVQEIFSCLHKYVTENEVGERLVVWSDACGGQNRNIKITALWMHLTQSLSTRLNVVQHKFYLSGHSHSANDRDFADVERKIRGNHNNIYHPNEWTEIIKTARIKNKFIVNEMKSDNFFSTDQWEKCLCNRKKNESGENVDWLKIKEIRLEREKPGILLYKYSYNETDSYHVVNLNRTLNGPSINIGEICPTKLYPTGKSISIEKKNDIESLLMHIPSIYHIFYTSLQGTKCTIHEDIHGFDENLDFEINY